MLNYRPVVSSKPGVASGVTVSREYHQHVIRISRNLARI